LLDFLLFGGAAGGLFDLVDDFLDLSGLGASPAGTPVQPPELIEDGATNAHRGIGGECVVLGGIVFADRRDEAGHAHAVEIVDVHMGRQIEFDPVHDLANEGQIAFNQFAFVDRLGGDALIGAPSGALWRVFCDGCG